MHFIAIQMCYKVGQQGFVQHNMWNILDLDRTADIQVTKQL